jgi:hypothetical protein
MALKFNPLTGNFDFTGSGGGGGDSYIDGEVQNFSALPETLGTPAVDSAYLVREAEGTWLLARKPAGIYIRTDNTGVRAADWTHAGAFPDVFNDANFLLYDNDDSSKNLAFQLSGITTGTTRTLTAPNSSGTIALNETFAAPPAIGNTTANSGAFSTLSVGATNPDITVVQLGNRANNTLTAYGTSYGSTSLEVNFDGGLNILNGVLSFGSQDTVLLRDAANTLAQRNGTNAQTFNIYNTFTDAANYERGFLRWSSNVFQVGTEAGGTGSARALSFFGASFDFKNRITFDTFNETSITPWRQSVGLTRVSNAPALFGSRIRFLTGGTASVDPRQRVTIDTSGNLLLTDEAYNANPNGTAKLDINGDTLRLRTARDRKSVV